ncbi:unnamed protein product, partial [Mesorhabditis belari]|uniref:EF-hand domain-containing protein n=1 Tax=Mesorhabditis belari TaxID=2138241 RepID=A0AAF3FAW0_9BILA
MSLKGFVPELSDQEIQDAFGMMDKKGSGRIAANELGFVMRQLRRDYPDSQLQKMINGRETIDFIDFINMLAEKPSTKDDEMRAAFQLFDKDGNGFISATELHDAMASLGEMVTFEEIDMMIREADDNHDGKVNYEEFIKMMSK